MEKNDNMNKSLKKQLKEGASVLGAWQVIPSTLVSNIICRSGFDFLIIDMEHGPFCFESSIDIINSIHIAESTALIRVPSKNESDILRSLEIGADGIIVPQINSLADAKKVIQWSKYSPIGDRGFSPFTISNGYTNDDDIGMANEKNKESFIGIILEGKQGFDEIEAILELNDLDLIYIGLYDLSQSLGCPGDIKNHKVQMYISEFTKLIRAQGKAVGTIANSLEDIENYRNRGIQFIAYKADCAILADACKNLVRFGGQKE